MMHPAAMIGLGLFGILGMTFLSIAIVKEIRWSGWDSEAFIGLSMMTIVLGMWIVCDCLLVSGIGSVGKTPPVQAEQE